MLKIYQDWDFFVGIISKEWNHNWFNSMQNLLFVLRTQRNSSCCERALFFPMIYPNISQS